LPGVIWARILYSTKPMETFTVPDEKTVPPEVKFD
jgi:hypothetical protein